MRLPTEGAQASRVWAGLRNAVDAAYRPTAATMPSPHGITVARQAGCSPRGAGEAFVVRPVPILFNESLDRVFCHLQLTKPRWWEQVPDKGGGLDVLPEVWAEMVEHSAKLASPWAMGHMDTAPHPAAALTDAVVSSLNNNLLFREISPLASVVEEQLIEEFATQLGLPRSSPGIWTSGGSLANLTALFAAAGGYRDDAPPRHQVAIVTSERSHASITKAGSVLGIRVATVPPTDNASGCADVARIENQLQKLQADGITRAVVVGTLGGTVNGHVDDIAALGDLCQRHGAWLHVDAIWGAALAYSTVPTTRAFLEGLQHADSVSLGPQKWLFAPRLCALTLFPKMLSAPEFDTTLAAVMPYSARRDDDHGCTKASNANRGTWGLQGSRRADCLALFATLQVLGREGIGRYVDDSILLTHKFYATVLARLDASSVHHNERFRVVPTHYPQLNLLNLRVNDGDRDLTLALQEKLHRRGQAWVSVAPVGSEHVLRCVLANPELTLEHCETLLDSLDAPLLA